MLTEGRILSWDLDKYILHTSLACKTFSLVLSVQNTIIPPPTCVFSLLYLFWFHTISPRLSGPCCACRARSSAEAFLVFISLHTVEARVRGHLFYWLILPPVLWQSKGLSPAPFSRTHSLRLSISIVCVWRPGWKLWNGNLAWHWRFRKWEHLGRCS